MDKFTFYRNATFGLLGINLVLLFLHLLPLFGGPPNGPDGGMMRAVDRLGLDDNQHELFLASAKAHQENMRQINSQQREVLLDYFQGLTTDKATSNREVPPEYPALNKEKVATTYQHFLAVKELLRPEQAHLYAPWVRVATQQLLVPRNPKR